ncbi:MAG: TPM domain-containing protein [Microbacterium sp.]|nr:TPM domain-containing protein [Microbacterium sp.]
MRALRALGLTAALAAVFSGAAMAASATDPVTLGSAHVVDEAGVLSSSQLAAAEQRTQKLSDDTDVDLWVVYVPTFTNPSSSEDWANQTARDNGLGPNQYLLAIAVDSRQFYLSGDSSGPVSGDQLSTIEQQHIQPRLAADDWAGATTAAVDGLNAAVGGGAGGGGGFVWAIVGILVVIAIVVIIVVVVRSRRRNGVPGGAQTGGPSLEQVDTDELARRASSALVQTDDAVRTSDQELEFARAQFGDAATTEFAAALAQAKANLDQAFALKQQLDDAVKDSEEETRAWNAQIIDLCERSNQSLDEKAAAFDDLRKLEQNAPEAFARAQQERAAAASGVDTAAQRLTTLSASYAPEALATVADNVEQAKQRIAFADQQLAAAEGAIGSGDGGQAAVGIRAAEQAIAQAKLLEDAVDKLGTDLAEGEKSVAALIQELEADVAAGSALPDPDGRVAAVITTVTTQLTAAKADLAGPARHPLATLKGLEAVNAQIDGVVQGARDAAAQEQRSRQMLGQVIMQAQAQVSAAEDYISARRGAIGAEARTRLAQAGAELVQAQQLQASDATTAMQHAQRADQLAGQALQSAQGDVGEFEGGGIGGMFGGAPARGGSGGGMLGAVLGGIVINSLLSGGGGGGGMFGGGSGGGGGGGFSPGSFGGGGTRSRRGGGRF